MKKRIIKKRKSEFPYDYKRVRLASVEGSATVSGNATPELIDALNKMVLIAYKMKPKQ